MKFLLGFLMFFLAFNLSASAEDKIMERKDADAAGYKNDTYYVIADCHFNLCAEFGRDPSFGPTNKEMCEYFEKTKARLLVYQAYGRLANGDQVRIQDDGRVQFIEYQNLHESTIGNLSVSDAKVREDKGVIQIASSDKAFSNLKIKRQANSQSSPDYSDLFYYSGEGKDSGARIGFTCYTEGPVR